MKRIVLAVACTALISGCRPQTTVCQGDISIRTASQLADFLDIGCTSITGSLAIRSDLTRVSIPGLTRIEPTRSFVSDLLIEYNGALTELDLPDLRRAAVNVEDNEVLASLALPALVEGSVTVKDNPALTTLALPAMVVGGVLVEDNDALATVNLPMLTQANLLVQRNGGLETLGLSSLAMANTIEVLDNPKLVELSLPALEYFGEPLQTWPGGEEWMRGRLIVVGNQALRSVRVDRLTTVASNGSGVEAGSHELGIVIADNPTLSSVSLWSLASFSNQLTIWRNPALVSLDLPALVNTGLSPLIISGTALEQVTLPSLVSGDVTLDRNLALTAVDLPRLEDRRLVVSRNASLARLDLPALEAVEWGTLCRPPLLPCSAGLSLSCNPALTEVSAARLVNGLVETCGNPLLEDLQLPMFVGTRETCRLSCGSDVKGVP